MEIRIIKPEEIPLIKDFAPREWHIDLSVLYGFHYGQAYFYPLVAREEAGIAGTGIAILNRDVAWLGTIVVKAPFRNRGIGTAITKELVRYAKERKCRGIMLTATELGAPIYRKLGFTDSSHYIFYKDGKISGKPDLSNIRKAEEQDYPAMADMDLQATGENRKEILYRCIKTGFKYIQGNRIAGYYLPDFGNGLIIAKSEKAGLDLLRYKMLNGAIAVAVPEKNQIANKFLESERYMPFMKAPRMYLDYEPLWHPEMVYARGSGHTG